MSLPFSSACFTVAEQATTMSVASVAVALRTVSPSTSTPSDSIGLLTSTSDLLDRFRPEPLHVRADREPGLDPLRLGVDHRTRAWLPPSITIVLQPLVRVSASGRSYAAPSDTSRGLFPNSLMSTGTKTREE